MSERQRVITFFAWWASEVSGVVVVARIIGKMGASGANLRTVGSHLLPNDKELDVREIRTRD